jgi:hypothetical protein
MKNLKKLSLVTLLVLGVVMAGYVGAEFKHIFYKSVEIKGDLAAVAPLLVTTVADQTGSAFEIRNSANTLIHKVDKDGVITFPSTLIGTGTSSIGWAVVAGANTACNTTCTTPCVFGVNTAATEADIVDCASATADECLCAGAS